MDDKIWNNGKDYFIEDSDFDEGAITTLPAGTELTRYSDQSKETIGVYFASKTGQWIKY